MDLLTECHFAVMGHLGHHGHVIGLHISSKINAVQSLIHFVG